MHILELTLKDGRKLSTSSVYIEATDAGLLEGYPFAAVNVESIANLPRRAVTLFGPGPVHLVKPIRRQKVDPMRLVQRNTFLAAGSQRISLHPS